MNKPLNPAPDSYAEITKATRMARALLDEKYSEQHIEKLLREKGFDNSRILAIIRQARINVMTDNLRLNKIAVWSVGVAWVIVVVLFMISDVEPDPNKAGFLQEFGLRLVLGGAVAFAILLVRQVVMWVNLINFEGKK